MKKRDFKYIISLIITGLLLFLIGLILGRSITGAVIGVLGESNIHIPFIAWIIVAGIIILVFVFRKRANIIQLIKQITLTLAIIGGFYALFSYIRNLEIISSMLALTFGVWAIIWIINAYTVLSKGSTIKKYTLNFLICLVFVLFYSLCDMAILVFNLGQTWVFVKDIFLIFLYTTFVFAAYRIYRIGKEFGFAEEASRIKELLKARRRY